MVDRGELYRPACRRVAVQPARGALRPCTERRCGDGHHVRHEPRLRLGGKFWVAIRLPLGTGHWGGRRDAGSRRLYQRVVTGPGPGPLLFAVRDHLPGRTDGDRPDRHIAGAATGLEDIVPDRWHPRTDSCW